MENNFQHLNALILVGGKSSRMGTDKSKLIYQKLPQYKTVFNLLKELFSEQNIYYATRDTTQIQDKSYITDVYPDLGPFGAIYSAFSFDATKAWLVLAIDLPYLNIDLLKLLIKQRDNTSIATTFQGQSKKYPEPLLTIWEPKAFPSLKEKLKNNKLSLTKILKENNTKIITIADHLIQNINTKQAFLKVKNDLNQNN